MTETEYQKQFLKEISRFYPHHNFFWNFPLEYDQAGRRIKSVEMPNYSLDFLSISEENKFHIWEFKKLNSEELLRGKVLGQIIFYDFMLKTNSVQQILKKLKDRYNYQSKIKKIEIKSWNIVVCGGQGWEIAAGVNPIMWWYCGGVEEYIIDNRIFKIHHFFHDQTDWDLKDIWDLSVLDPRRMNQYSYNKYLEQCGEFVLPDKEVNMGLDEVASFRDSEEFKKFIDSQKI
jgi:hypothetical protein